MKGKKVLVGSALSPPQEPPRSRWCERWPICEKEVPVSKGDKPRRFCSVECANAVRQEKARFKNVTYVVPEVQEISGGHDKDLLTSFQGKKGHKARDGNLFPHRFIDFLVDGERGTPQARFEKLFKKKQT